MGVDDILGNVIKGNHITKMSFDSSDDYYPQAGLKDGLDTIIGTFQQGETVQTTIGIYTYEATLISIKSEFKLQKFTLVAVVPLGACSL